MDRRRFKYAAISRVPELSVRFTNFPEVRERRLDKECVKFLPLPDMMTRVDAAVWLRTDGARLFMEQSEHSASIWLSASKHFLERSARD